MTTEFSPSEKQRPERRIERSSLPREAARLYLRSLARRAGIRALVLGDDDGSVIAGAGERATLSRLAKAGADSAADRSGWRQRVDELASGGPFFSLRVSLGESRWRLSGLGNVLLGRPELEDSLARILGPQLAAAEA